MKFEKSLIGEQRLRYRWPLGEVEDYPRALTYRVRHALKTTDLIVAFGWRDAFRATRRRAIVFTSEPEQWPLVEFVGTDDYESTHELLWAVKKPGGNGQYTLSEEPHPDFRSFKVIPFRDRIAAPGAFTGWAVLVQEDDHDTMLNLALVRASHRAVRLR